MAQSFGERAPDKDVKMVRDEYIEREYLKKFGKLPREEDCERVKKERLREIEGETGMKWSGGRDELGKNFE